MYCSKCGSKILDIASFCSNCGAPNERHFVSSVPKKQTLKEWINRDGKLEARKEIKVLKILTYTTITILSTLFLLTIVGFVLLDYQINKEFNEFNQIDNMRWEVDYSLIEQLLNSIGIPFALAILFGILGIKKNRTGFSISYLIFGELSFLISVGLLFGGGLHNLIYMAIAAVPFSFIIAIQSKINKKYKAAVARDETI